MQRKITVGVSNHHVHLTKEIYDKLFDEPLNKVENLHQIGEFVSDKLVTVQTDKGVIQNVRVLGPLRDYNQVEIDRTDAYLLGINPPVRRSGVLENSETVTLKTEKGSAVLKNSCILAERHVHMQPDMARELNLKDGELVKVLVNGDKACILYATIKVSNNAYYELHLDFDDANAAGLKNGDEVDIIF